VAPRKRDAAFSANEREPSVGWARSFVRSPDRREILFDLETARREVFETEGKSSIFDQLSKCGANLLRMWADD
jgi:PKHD-type hydroxylase